jgi:hypothetical protein
MGMVVRNAHNARLRTNCVCRSNRSSGFWRSTECGSHRNTRMWTSSCSLFALSANTDGKEPSNNSNHAQVVRSAVASKVVIDVILWSTSGKPSRIWAMCGWVGNTPAQTVRLQCASRNVATLDRLRLLRSRPETEVDSVPSALRLRRKPAMTTTLWPQSWASPWSAWVRASRPNPFGIALVQGMENSGELMQR